MPRRRTAKPKENAPRVRAPRRKKDKFEIPERAEAKLVLQQLYEDMMTRIKAGYGSFGAKEELAQIRERTAAIAAAYPAIWEEICTLQSAIRQKEKKP